MLEGVIGSTKFEQMPNSYVVVGPKGIVDIRSFCFEISSFTLGPGVLRPLTLGFSVVLGLILYVVYLMRF